MAEVAKRALEFMEAVIKGYWGYTKDKDIANFINTHFEGKVWVFNVTADLYRVVLSDFHELCEETLGLLYDKDEVSVPDIKIVDYIQRCLYEEDVEVVSCTSNEDSEEYVIRLNKFEDEELVELEWEEELIEIEELDGYEPTLYPKAWTNTGMPNQVTWVFNVVNPDDTLGDHIGDYVAVSADKQRVYHIHGSKHSAYVEFNGFCFYPADENDHEEWVEYGFDADSLCRCFVTSCEEVFNDEKAEVPCDIIVRNMIEMSKRFGLGWVKDSIKDGWEETPVVYSEALAKKAHIGEDVVYCFCEKSLVETMRENPGAKCSFVKEYVVMIYPNGEQDEEMAYVVYLADTLA